MDRKHVHLDLAIPWPKPHITRESARRLLPSPGSAIFTLVVVGLLLWAQSAGALPLPGTPANITSSTNTIAYQGRLANAGGAPLTGVYSIIFRLYNAASGGVPLWEEQWTGPNGVSVSDGLFNVMLGSLTPIPQAVVTGNNTLWLGVTVGTDNEMVPRVQLGSVPFAVQALTVPDSSVTTAKIADGAVTQVKLGPDVNLVPPDGSITTAKLADGAVTSAKLARSMTRVLLPSDFPMPTANVWYDILSTSIDLSRSNVVTIHASVAPQNNSIETFFTTEVLVDGTAVIQGEKMNRAGFGNTIMMSTSLIVGPGQHQVKLRVVSWQSNSFVCGGDLRTQLEVVEG